MTDPIKAEPVAWMYEGPHGADLCLAQWADGKWYAPRNWRDWTETPLYTHAQLVEERRLAWNEAIEAAGALVERLYLRGKPHERHPLFIHNAIRALSVPAIVEAGEHQPKENTDAG